MSVENENDLEFTEAESAEEQVEEQVDDASDAQGGETETGGTDAPDSA